MMRVPTIQPRQSLAGALLANLRMRVTLWRVRRLRRAADQLGRRLGMYDGG
jgi:hypothetical protein